MTDASVVRRIDKAYRGKIMQVDLQVQGITNFGEITRRGSPGLELFFQGKRMTIARYPNSGWLEIADVPQSGEKRFHEGLAREKRYDGVPAGRHYGRITYSGDRPRGWSKDNEIYLHGYWTFDWSDSYQKESQIDQYGASRNRASGTAPPLWLHQKPTFLFSEYSGGAGHAG